MIGVHVTIIIFYTRILSTLKQKSLVFKSRNAPWSSKCDLQDTNYVKLHSKYRNLLLQCSKLSKDLQTPLTFGFFKRSARGRVFDSNITDSESAGNTTTVCKMSMPVKIISQISNKTNHFILIYSKTCIKRTCSKLDISLMQTGLFAPKYQFFGQSLITLFWLKWTPV